jgi:hypothetical protein
MAHVLKAKLSAEYLFSRLHERFGGDVDPLMKWMQEVVRIAEPQALYRAVQVENRTAQTVVINGIELTSRVLSVNLEGTLRVFPFVATCGMGLDQWLDEKAPEIMAETSCGEGLSLIREIALRIILEQLNAHLMNTWQPGDLSMMNPGSLKDWPLAQQQPLLQLIGDVERKIAIRLTASGMMIPAQSVSGILFPSRKKFDSCMLCPRENCPIRRSSYEPELYDSKYRLKI